jgi:hypothetical protein
MFPPQPSPRLAFNKAGSDPRNLAGLNRGPQLVTRGRELHSGGTNVSAAPCSLAKSRIAPGIGRNLALRTAIILINAGNEILS